MANTRGSDRRRPARTERTSQTKGEMPKSELLDFIPEKFRSATWIVLLLLTLMIFFGGVIFNGEYFASNDNISWESYRPYLQEMADKGESPQWMPYIFSGMPGVASYMVTGERSWDISMWIMTTTETVFAVINYDVMRVLFYYLLLGIGLFVLMRHKGMSRPISFFTAFATIFSTWIIVWVMIGHNTKPMTLAYLPWTILFLDKLFERWSFLYAGLLVLSVHFILESVHPQTAFYAAATLGIWTVAELIAAGRNNSKRAKNIVFAGLTAVLAAGFAYGMGMDRFMAIQEYNDYSTRGATSIVDTTGVQGESAEDQYAYATNWSFDIDETFTYAVPGYFGFGQLSVDIPGAAEAPTLRTYWGDMPFTDAGHYMGIIVLILGLFGLWRYRKNPFVVGLAAAGLFGLLISYGKNLAFVYDIFYNYLPYFDKFRAPSQSLVMLEFVFPILAGFGLHSLIQTARKGGTGSDDLAQKFMKFGVIGSGAFLILGFLVSAGNKEGYIENVLTGSGIGAQLQNRPELAQAAAEAVHSGMMTDWIFAGLVGIALCLLAWAYLNRRITTPILQVALLGVLLIDLWRVDYKAMHDNVPKEEAFSVFQATDVDAFLKQDQSQYRIVDARNGRHPSYPAYQMHQHIGGYSAAKLRIYQDLMDVTANGSTSMPGQGPGLTWNILNAKYLLLSQPQNLGWPQVYASQTGAGFVFENPDAMPRAWLVDRVEVSDGLTILKGMRDNAFDPWDVAYVLEPLDASIDPVGATAPVSGDGTQNAETVADDAPAEAPDSTATETPAATSDHSDRAKRVTITNWEPHHISMQVDAPGNNFLVVSEMHYPPGWHATIDGEPAEIIQTNYIMRGLVIPAGTHEVKFEYLDEAFETGTTISLILNLIVFGIIGLGIAMEMRRRKEGEPVAESDVDATDDQNS